MRPPGRTTRPSSAKNGPRLDEVAQGEAARRHRRPRRRGAGAGGRRPARAARRCGRRRASRRRGRCRSVGGRARPARGTGRRCRRPGRAPWSRPAGARSRTVRLRQPTSMRNVMIRFTRSYRGAIASNIDRTAADLLLALGEVVRVDRGHGPIVGAVPEPAGFLGCWRRVASPGHARCCPHPAAAVGGEGATAATDHRGSPARWRSPDLDRRPGRASCGRSGRRGPPARPDDAGDRALHGRAVPELDAASLPATREPTAARSTLIVSGLWGCVAPADPIPPTGSRCRRRWRRSGSCRRGGGRSSPPRSRPGPTGAVVWDLLPNEHAAAIDWTDAGAAHDGSPSASSTRSGRTVSHWNKLLKGSIVRWLVEGGFPDPADLADFDHPQGYRFDRGGVRSRRRSGRRRAARGRLRRSRQTPAQRDSRFPGSAAG